jgi:hypothetical protein
MSLKVMGNAWTSVTVRGNCTDNWGMPGIYCSDEIDRFRDEM